MKIFIFWLPDIVFNTTPPPFPKNEERICLVYTFWLENTHVQNISQLYTPDYYFYTCKNTIRMQLRINRKIFLGCGLNVLFVRLFDLPSVGLFICSYSIFFPEIMSWINLKFHTYLFCCMSINCFSFHIFVYNSSHL